MKINRAVVPSTNSLLAIALVLSASGCVSAPPPAPAPVRTLPPARPAPAPQPAAPAPADWRDLPQTPGTWTYAAGTARFGQPGAAPLVSLQCNRAAGQILIVRAGSAAQPVPAAITTSAQQRPLSASPYGAESLAIALPVRDSLLDAMAFSRGRFVLEVNGLSTLALPAWAEVGRVIEDCR